MSSVSIDVLFIILAILSGCKSRQEGKIFVLYSSFLDFHTNDSDEFVMVTNISSPRLTLVDLKTSRCSGQSAVALNTLIMNWKLIASLFSSIVGPSCSDSAYAVAQLIRRSGVSVRHLHTAPLPAPLAAEVRGTSEGLLPPADLLADASVALVKHANWSKVLAFYQPADTEMLYIFEHFQKEIEEYYAQMNIIKKGNRSLNVSPMLGNPHVNRTLRHYSARIVFLMADIENAAIVLCKALELEAFFPKYQWVIIKLTMEEVLQTLNNCACTRTNISQITEEALFINNHYQVTPNGSFENFFSTHLYTNTVQIALNRSRDLSSHHLLFPPKACIIQQRNSKPVVVSEYYNGSLVSLRNTDYISSSLEIVLNVVYFPLGVFFIVINAALLLVASLLHALTVLYRKHHSIKSSSVFLLHTTYIGIYLVNIASTIYFTQKTFVIVSDLIYIRMCQCFLPLISIGVTLLFGTLLAKTWRLYKIFIHYMDPGNFLSDVFLIFFVVCLTQVDVVICLVWFIVDPIHRENFEVSRDSRESQVLVQAVCESEVYVEMLALIILYQIIIVVMTMYLVFKLRKSIPKRHKNLRSASIVRLSFLMAFGVLFVVPGYALSHYYLMAIEFEYTMVGVLFDSLQFFFIILFFIPPLRPILSHKFLLLTHIRNLK